MKLDLQSIIQALITAAVTASIVMYASVRVLDNRVETLQRDLQRVENSVNRMQQDFYPPVNRGNR